MKICYFTVNAFTMNGEGGNKAGVVLFIKNLDHKNSCKSDIVNRINELDYINFNQLLQKVAQKIGYSETAFVFLHKEIFKNRNLLKNKIKIRYFTSEKEIDYCGHATLAACKVLKQTFFTNGNNEFVFITRAGEIKTKIEEDNKILISQKLPLFLETIDKEEVEKLFYFDKSQFMENTKNSKSPYDIFLNETPLQVVNTGINDLMVGIKNHNILLNLKPDFEKISAFQKRHNLEGLHLFALYDDKNNVNLFNNNNNIDDIVKFQDIKIYAYCRNFSPLYGINEESATGSASGSLLCYLYKNQIINTNLAQNGVFFLQGENLKQKSLIYTKIVVKKNVIKKIYVGGRANILTNRYLNLQ